MPHKIAEHLREAAIECDRLAHATTDRKVANELEGVAAELAQCARKLDELLNHIESNA
jgi:hypothetical protein